MNLTRVISLVKSSKTTKQAKLVHQKTITHGLQNNTLVTKNLVKLYMSCHNHQSAKTLLFKTLTFPNPSLDITLWNGVMSAFAKRSVLLDTLHVFDQMLSWHPFLKPDEYSFTSVLKACGGLKRVTLGRIVHAHLARRGFLRDVVVGGCLVGMYAKGGFFGDAVRVFEGMGERDVASWNTVVSCFYQDGQFGKALEVFDRMKGDGVVPDSVGVTTAVSACGRVLDLEKGRGIHRELVVSGVEVDGFVGSALVDMYGRCGCLDTAREVFEGIQRKSVVAWNSMIFACSLKGDSGSCVEYFGRMIVEGNGPTLTTMSSILMACSRSANVLHGRFVHGYIVRNNIDTDIFTDSSLIDMYFKCARVQSAKNIFDRIPKVNVVAWNVMISGMVTVGSNLEALRIYDEMREAGVKPDAITFTSILTACSHLAALQKGREIHRCVTESKLNNSEVVMGALLDMYAKCGAVDEALDVFYQLPGRDLVSWTSMITAYGNHGYALEALRLFSQMQQSNVKPDRVTFLAVLSACSHAGLVDEGCYYFDQMTAKYNIKPNTGHYSCLIDLLGRAGRLHDAYALIRKTPETKENVDLLSTLLSACSLHKESELGEKIANLLIEKDPDDPSTYVVLSNMYASSKKWDKARMVRLKMKELGLKKNPGCSWIEINKRIHQFLAKDISHPQSDIIIKCIEILACHMERVKPFPLRN